MSAGSAWTGAGRARYRVRCSTSSASCSVAIRCRPRLSPSKTWEGLVGGIASATLLGAALWWINPFSLPAAAGMAFVICVTGFFGSLVLSAIKRDRGVKDWGRMIRGHGGILDRLDSVIFAAPAFLHLTRFWYAV